MIHTCECTRVFHSSVANLPCQLHHTDSMTSSTSTPPEREANKKHKEFVSCRQTLHFLVFFGFMANYMLRVNLSLTIVEMVGHHPQRNSNLSGLANETNDDTLTSNYTSNKVSKLKPRKEYGC
nr:PREDICTED: uncharacterized protein LOC109038623 [Bemisia tabaci]